jgi:inorganic pyrophosphatase
MSDPRPAPIPADANADPEVFEVVVEITRGSRNKYEMDHERHILKLDRRLFSATGYPADYGFVPDTLAEDGDPLDVLVLLEEPTFPGCYIDVRAVGMLTMVDDAGPDAKLLCVPAADPRRDHLMDIGDLDPFFTAEVEHYFEVYKQLEPGKMSETGGFQDRVAAYAELAASRSRYTGPGMGAGH